MTTTERLVDVVAVVTEVRARRLMSMPALVARLIADDLPVVFDDVFPPALDTTDRDAARAHATAQVASWGTHGHQVLTILDDGYPVRLASVHQAPPLLFAEGNVLADDMGVSVVGSRVASPEQLGAAAATARRLVGHGLTVVSGLAAGIDTAAHEAALAVGGRTVAVMGTGLAHTYPSANRGLRRRIVAGGGAVFSQFDPDDRGGQHTFPMRNEVMSGYGVATIVVAAAEKSGTRHQVQAAVRHGRGVVLARPVAESTSWGRALAEQPSVRVAATAGEAADAAAEFAATVTEALRLFS